MIAFKFVSTSPNRGFVTARGWEQYHVPVEWRTEADKQALIKAAKLSFLEKLVEVQKRKTQ